MPNCEKIQENAKMGNIRMDLGLNNKESLFVDTHAAVAAQNDEMGDAFKDSHAAVAAQNDSFGEWAQNDKTGYIPNTTHTEELFPSCHTEEFSLFCHTEERSDVSIHNSKCHIFSFCAFSLLSIITLSFSAPAQAQGLQFVYIFNDVQMAQEPPKPPKCVKPNPAECVWEIPGKFDSRGCPEIQYCVDKDHDKTICLEGRCVECITNADCLITEPICQNNVCVPCPDGMKYDKEKKECVCPEPTKTVCNETALTYDTNGCPLNKYEACTEPKTVCDTDNKTCICSMCSDPNNMIQDINCNCTCNTTKGFESSPVNGVCCENVQLIDGTYQCLPPCEDRNASFVVMIDKSVSLSLSAHQNVANLLNGLQFPTDLPSALYYSRITVCGGSSKAWVAVPYGESLQDYPIWVNSTSYFSCHGAQSAGDAATSFGESFESVAAHNANLSPQKILIIVFTDTELNNKNLIKKALNDMQSKGHDVSIIWVDDNNPTPIIKNFIPNGVNASYYLLNNLSGVQSAIDTWGRNKNVMCTEQNPQTSFASYSNDMILSSGSFNLGDSIINWWMSKEQCRSFGDGWFYAGEATDKNSGLCYSCSTTNVYSTSLTDCQQCRSSRYHGDDGKCYPCNGQYEHKSSASECFRCPNRSYNYTNGNCVRRYVM